MKKGNLGRALFSGVFVGIISFTKELLFPGLNSILSILLMVVAALIGYWLGNKIVTKREELKNGRATT